MRTFCDGLLIRDAFQRFVRGRADSPSPRSGEGGRRPDGVRKQVWLDEMYSTHIMSMQLGLRQQSTPVAALRALLPSRVRKEEPAPSELECVCKVTEGRMGFGKQVRLEVGSPRRSVTDRPRLRRLPACAIPGRRRTDPRAALRVEAAPRRKRVTHTHFSYFFGTRRGHGRRRPVSVGTLADELRCELAHGRNPSFAGAEQFIPMRARDADFLEATSEEQEAREGATSKSRMIIAQGAAAPLRQSGQSSPAQA